MMNGRRFPGRAAGLAAAQKKPLEESITASATFNRTPQVAIVSSNFRGGEDHDGTRLEGLRDPVAVDQELSEPQLRAMVEKAISLGGIRGAGLAGIIDAEDWVLLLPDTSAAAEPLVTLAVVSFLAARKRGKRFTIAGGAWSDGLAAQLAARYPEARFESIDLDRDEYLEAPLLSHPERVYRVAQSVRRCDRIITLAPLAMGDSFGISLSAANYLKVGRAVKAAVPPEQMLCDLFSHHPADYAVAGGTHAVEGGGRTLRFNVVAAGPNATAVDAVGAALIGYDPRKLPLLDRMVRNGLGVADPDSTWTRGDEIESVRRRLRRPDRWERAS